MIINLAGGTGEMGRVHKPLFEKYGHEVIISGRKTSPSLEEAAADSDMTIVSVPIPHTEEIIRRVGPYCNAMMDFTGLKVFPLAAMWKYTLEDIEIGGLHPMYGEVKNLNGKTIIYCPTERSEDKCDEIVECFRKEGLVIKTMSAQDHDNIPCAIGQNSRTLALQSIGSLMESYHLTARELYELSPPPTRILIDLLARQIDEKNDDLYWDMKAFNPATSQIREFMIEHLQNDSRDFPKRIREVYGDEFLSEAQERAKKLIEMNR